MKRKKNALLICLMLILPLVYSTLKINPVNASTAEVYIDPPQKIDFNLVVGMNFTVNVTVAAVTDLKSFYFEMSFNPDVVHGVWFDETQSPPWPVGIGPFLESAGGSGITLPGPGWNNTRGKLSLTGASLLFPTAAQCPDGGGVLANVTFQVVGKGETELRLEDVDLRDINDSKIDLLTVDSGYFRNVDSALIPTADFTFTPVDTPPEQGPLRGYYTQFNGTLSTATSGRTIAAYKWYFWMNVATRSAVPHDNGLDGPIVFGSIVEHNYTRWGTWSVSLTVIDDTGVVDTTTQNVTVKAHDVYFSNIYTNTTMGIYPAVLYTDIGDIIEIKATAINEGNYTETFNVSTFWSGFYADVGQVLYGPIGTVTDITLNAGQSQNVTFHWDTTGYNLTHADTFAINANASRVQYEYDTEWETGKIADNLYTTQPIRVRFHDIAITRINLYNATGHPLTEPINPGDTVRVNVTVVNEGDFTESSLTVTAYYDNTVIDTDYIYRTVNRTYAARVLYNRNDTITLRFNWDTTDVPDGLYTIKADVTQVTDEYDTYDNVYVDGRVRWYGIPFGAFTYSPYPPIVDEPVTFNASESFDDDGYIVSMTFSWGDGTADTILTTEPWITSHTYTAVDTYNVTLTVTDNDTKTSSTSQWVTVSGPLPPVALFKYSPDSPLVGETIRFDASTSYDLDGDIVSYEWDFGDGNTTTVVDPVIFHTYSTAAVYTVTLNVTDDDGFTAETSDQITVLVHDVAVIDVRVSLAEAVVGESVVIYVDVENEGNFTETFYVSANANDIIVENQTVSSLGAGSIRALTLSWDTTGFTAGVYTIKAVASTVQHETDTDDNTMTYGAVTLLAPLVAPVASFTYSPSSPVEGDPVTFDASDSSDTDGSIVSYEWDFGDGNTTTVTAHTIVHTYSTADTYNVNLTVTDDDGLTNSTADQITVSAAPIHDIAITDVTVSTTTVTVGDSVSINVTVKNEGTVAETFHVTVYYDENNAIETKTATDLAPDASETLTFTWETVGLSPKDYSISANVPSLPQETDTDDNTLVYGTVTVEEKEAPPISNIQYYAVAGVIIVVAVVAVVYFWKIRK